MSASTRAARGASSAVAVRRRCAAALTDKDVAADSRAGVGGDDGGERRRLDLGQVLADVALVLPPVQAAGAEEAAVELLDNDRAQRRRQRPAGLRLTQQAQPRIGRLRLDLDAVLLKLSARSVGRLVVQSCAERSALVDTCAKVWVQGALGHSRGGRHWAIGTPDCCGH